MLIFGRNVWRRIWRHRVDICELVQDRNGVGLRTWSGYAEEFGGNVTLYEAGPKGAAIYSLGTQAAFVLRVGVRNLADLLERPGTLGRPNYLSGISLDDRDVKYKVEFRDYGRAYLCREDVSDDRDCQMNRDACRDWDGSEVRHPIGIAFSAARSS